MNQTQEAPAMQDVRQANTPLTKVMQASALLLRIGVLNPYKIEADRFDPAEVSLDGDDFNRLFKTYNRRQISDTWWREAVLEGVKFCAYEALPIQSSEVL